MFGKSKSVQFCIMLILNLPETGVLHNKAGEICKSISYIILAEKNKILLMFNVHAHEKAFWVLVLWF